MLGDQLALAWVVRSNPNFDARTFSRREAFVYKIGGASVLFLPCSLYNWTPPEGAGQFHGMPLDVKVNKHIYLVTGRFCYISSNIFLLMFFQIDISLNSGLVFWTQVVHFKGSRKRLMLESWNFLSSSNLSDMLCLILKSGRTKYDF